MNNTYCVIMAGGIGSRFWPMSKSTRPKQFIDILGTGQSLIQQTFDRLKNICALENFLVVTSRDYKDLVKEHLPELQDHQILSEPLRRNTAPCIAYACYKIKQLNPNAKVIVAPSDHLITKEIQFLNQLKRGLNYVEKNDVLLTLGIRPHRPETGYGYIQISNQIDFEGATNLYQVKTFTEKPDIKMAQVFMESGEFFWNSGIFIWSVKTIVKSFEEHLPEINKLFKKGKKHYNTPDEIHVINKAYSECPNISIDYGIMEKADNVSVLTADFGWSDLGTWGSLYENVEKDSNGNVTSGDNVIVYDSHNCIIKVPDEKLVVVQGMENYIIVESDNTMLICNKEEEQQIRQFVTDVRINKGDEFV
ncbi:mannose-1-phosphate guanylyltransferase [Puteibacter caeruleilacunae]|nr:mannose-1-phosphate guanylyltransferase [Puteibacter caeruleilacunae]